MTKYQNNLSAQAAPPTTEHSTVDTGWVHPHSTLAACYCALPTIRVQSSQPAPQGVDQEFNTYTYPHHAMPWRHRSTILLGGQSQSCVFFLQDHWFILHRVQDFHSQLSMQLLLITSQFRHLLSRANVSFLQAVTLIQRNEIASHQHWWKCCRCLSSG